MHRKKTRILSILVIPGLTLAYLFALAAASPALAEPANPALANRTKPDIAGTDGTACEAYERRAFGWSQSAQCDAAALDRFPPPDWPSAAR
jgi:hypothetical protein